MDLLNQKYIQSRFDYCAVAGHLTWLPVPVARLHEHGRWNTRYAGKVAGTIRRADGYRVVSIDGKIYLIHRIIWLHVHGELLIPDQQIDHINGDPLDNRLVNLRVVNRQENGRNAKRPKSNKSGVVGVGWHKANQKWQAYIKVSKKSIHLGVFTDFDQAVKVRKAAEIKHGFHSNHGRD